jgi:hypothetical protein
MNGLPGSLSAGALAAGALLQAEFQAKLAKLKSRTLVFGASGGYSSFRGGDLASDLNLSEFTTVILDSGLAFAKAGTPWQLYYFNAIVARLRELNNWIEDGHTAIIVLRNIGPIAVVGGGVAFALDQLPLFNFIQYSETSGTQIEYFGPSAAESFFKPWLARLCYDLIISSKPLRPLLRVNRGSKGSDQLVGGIVKIGLGRIIFVPYVVGKPLSGTHLEYLESLAGLPERLPEASAELPDWAANFQTTDERHALDNIDALRSKISEIENTIRMEEDKISQAGHLKTLFAGSGDAFVAAVNDALTELGLRVVDGPHPRADLIAVDDTLGILAIEAKGLDGSAREANLRQAERWIADVRYACAASEEELRTDADMRNYKDKLTALDISFPAGQDINVRGLMVIGTFRKTPLDKRPEPDFPDAIMRVASRSEVCVITGLQLLLMILQSRNDPTFKAKFIEQLFTTSSQPALDITWRDFLISQAQP